MQNQSVKTKVYANAGNPEVVKHLTEKDNPDGPWAILDIGCGAGDNASYLTGLGHMVDGITLSEEEAARARTFCQEVSVHNLEQGLPEVFMHKKYDFVLCSHVLEHICFPEKLMEDILGVLKTDGSLIVALPNLMFIKNRWNLLRGRFQYRESGLMDNTHFRWYTFKTSEQLLETHGFVLTKHYASGFLPLGPIRRAAPHTARRFDRFLCNKWPGLFGYQNILVAKRAAAVR